MYKDEEEDDDEFVKELPGFMSPTPPKLKAFTGPITPKELPKMIVRIPEEVKKPQAKKVEPKPSKSEESIVTQSEVVVEIPKADSPHED